MEASKTHFGFTNMVSEMHIFRVTGIWISKLWFGSPCRYFSCSTFPNMCLTIFVYDCRRSNNFNFNSKAIYPLSFYSSEWERRLTSQFWRIIIQIGISIYFGVGSIVYYIYLLFEIPSRTRQTSNWPIMLFLSNRSSSWWSEMMTFYFEWRVLIWLTHY